MQHRLRSDGDERMTTAVVDAIERHVRVEDAFVETDQPIHVGGEEGHVMQVVDQGHELASLENVDLPPGFRAP
jgi:hypothetical protein